MGPPVWGLQSFQRGYGYDARMRMLAAVAVLLMTGPPQQVPKPVPAASFRLHPKGPLPGMLRSPWQVMVMVSTPPEAVITATADRRRVLALIPQKHDRWELERLTGWQTGTPRVESLTFDGDVPYRREDYVRGAMTVSPDGRSLLVRIFALDTVQWKRSAVVLLVDLRSFTVVWRRRLDDPLVANARWRFLNADTLAAVEGPPPAHKGHPVVEMKISQDILQMNPVSAGEHEAGILSLPNLEVRSRCSYKAMVPRQIDDSGEAYSEAAGRIEAGSGCSPLLAAAGVASIDALPGLREVKSRIGYPEESGCRMEDRSDEAGLAVFNCREGYMTEKYGYVAQAEEERVTPLDGPGAMMSVKLKRYERHSVTLASADGHVYLLLLRDKERIEMYKVR